MDLSVYSHFIDDKARLRKARQFVQAPITNTEWRSQDLNPRLSETHDRSGLLDKWLDQQTDPMRALLLLGVLLVSLESAVLVKAVGTRRVVLGWPWGVPITALPSAHDLLV